MQTLLNFLEESRTNLRLSVVHYSDYPTFKMDTKLSLKLVSVDYPDKVVLVIKEPLMRTDLDPDICYELAQGSGTTVAEAIGNFLRKVTKETVVVVDTTDSASDFKSFPILAEYKAPSFNLDIAVELVHQYRNSLCDILGI